MRRTVSVAILTCLVAVPAIAFAFAPTLDNDDDRSYEFEVDCVATKHGEINANVERTISKYEGCTLTVKGAGSVELKEGMECTIEDGNLSCQ